jgi:hypothetical protein
MSKPIALSGEYKRGSYWAIVHVRRNPDDSGVDMTGLVTRDMFRANGLYEPVVVTLNETAGIVIDDPTSGRIGLELSRDQTPLFAAGDKVFFDIEQTDPLNPKYEWQSKTYWFKVIEQVTRDD